MCAGMCTVVIVFYYYLLVFLFLELFKNLASFMILMMIFINFLYLVYFYNNECVHKVLCSGGPRHKPPGVSRGSPRLHFILMCMLVQLVVCCDRNKVQFNSKNIIASYRHFIILLFPRLFYLYYYRVVMWNIKKNVRIDCEFRK